MKRAKTTGAVPDEVVPIIDLLRVTVDRADFPYEMRLVIAAAVRRAIVPQRKPGKKDHRLDKAYADYKAGMRGLALFCKYIPNLDRLSRWRRTIEQNRLLKTLQKRAEREKKRQQALTVPPNELSPRQIDSANCHPDNSV